MARQSPAAVAGFSRLLGEFGGKSGANSTAHRSFMRKVRLLGGCRGILVSRKSAPAFHGEAGMRKAAAALGLFAGWWGLIFAIVAATEARDFSTPTAWLPLVAIVLCVAGLVATALALSHPQPSWMIMGFAGVVLVVATLVSYMSYSDQSDLWRWLLPGILLIVGSALEFAGRTSKVKGVAQSSP
jgi:FtsH-binding integral membrane protein